MSELYLAKGKITVTAEGFWFTSGGEKGSFGYYPHLKDGDGYPVYPDTQLHGNLMMALDWFFDLKNKNLNATDITSSIFVTDLCLKDKTKWDQSRFQVKPRIKIDEKKRTVAEHMLGFLEMAYLEGLELEADIFVGYLKRRQELDDLKGYISKSVSLLNSMGAFRSRGFGRGRFAINWDEDMEIVPGESPEPLNEVFYSVTNLTNFRNKPIEPGSYQNIITLTYISPEQFRGWLVRTYNHLYDEWPRMEEVSKLKIQSLYPCLLIDNEVIPSFPASMSTITTEGGEITDMSGRAITDEDERASSMVRAKRKALPEDAYVTDESPFRVLRTPLELRIRNSLDDRFVSLKQGGLFVQEFIPRGNHFGGRIKFTKGADLSFVKRICFMIENVYPLIKGTLFKPSVKSITEGDKREDGGFHLLTEPVPYSESLFKEGRWKAEARGDGRYTASREGVNMLRVGTIRRYNTTLSRPRRPKIVFEPGSVITEAVEMKTLPWKGFGSDGIWHAALPQPAIKSKGTEKPADKDAETLAKSLRKLSRSQIGFLRNFLNRNIPIKTLRTWAEDRAEKFREKQKTELYKLYSTIIKKMEEDPDGDSMRRFIEDLIDTIRLIRWEEEHTKVKEGSDERV